MTDLTIIEQDKGDYLDLIQKSEHHLGQMELTETQPQRDESSVAAFFRAKCALMTEYLAFQQLYILHRVQNGGEMPEELVNGLLYTKTLLSKMTNTQKKLQYQVDKIIQMASKQTNEVDQPVEQESDEDNMALKPRPHLLESQYQVADDTTDKKYVPPRLSAALSKQDMIQEKIQKQEERRKIYLKRRLKQTLIEDENNDAPEELQTQDYQRRYFGQEEDEVDLKRKKYEEENFVRLPKTKADKIRDKKREKQIRMEDRLDNLGELGNINQLLQLEGLGGDDKVAKTDRNIQQLKRKQQLLNQGQRKKFTKLKKLK